LLSSNPPVLSLSLSFSLTESLNMRFALALLITAPLGVLAAPWKG